MSRTAEPLLTVIVPVYNTEKYLFKCVDSLLHQSYENLEIFLVDDGSTDGSPQLCDRFGAEDNRIHVIHKENGGQALARNRALMECNGAYVTFADSDDWLEEDAYEAMMALAKKSGADVVCCGRYNVKEKTGEKTLGLCPEEEEILSSEEMLKKMFTWDGCDCSPCDKIFKASLFDTLRFPEKSGFEDIAILYQLILKAEKTALLPKPCYNYLQRAGSTSYGAVSERIFRYPMYTKQVYEDICRDHPAVKDQVRFLRVYSLSWVLVLLDQAERETRKTWKQEEKTLRRDLRQHICYILRAPYFGTRQRITDLLLSLNLYRFFRKFCHREG